jgi:hypothetical protein
MSSWARSANLFRFSFSAFCAFSRLFLFAIGYWLLVLRVGPYSRSAVTGLTRTARSAGNRQARQPAKQRTKAAISIEIGSVAATP